MNNDNNSASKIVDEKIRCDNSIKGKLLRTFDKFGESRNNSSDVKLKITINRYL